MNVFIIESTLNYEIVDCVRNKYNVETDLFKIKNCNVLIVGLVEDIKLALKIIDIALQNGIEVICIKYGTYKKAFVSNLLINEGAIYI